MPIRALIFDFDGLILDTESSSLQCWQELYHAHNLTFPIDRWLASLGCAVRAFDPYDHLVSTVGPPLTNDILRARRRERETELVHRQPLCPGITSWLQAARQFPLRMAIASSSSRAWVEGHLLRHNIRSFFDALVCKEDTPRHKPDPAPYLAALGILEIPPQEAIALEDSPNGIAAAKAAGLFVLAVPNAITRELDLSHAHRVIPSLDDLSLATLIEQMYAARNQHQSSLR